MRANEFLRELFEPKKPTWEWQFRGSEEAVADFKVGEVPYRFHAYSNGENDWEVEFKIRTTDKSRDARQQLKTRFGLTGTGNSTEVMSTVVDIMREFLEMYRGKIDTIGFSAEEPSRQKLYMRMLKRLLPNWDIHTYDSGTGLGFTVAAPDNLEEDVLDETTAQDQILVHVADAATKRVIDIFTDKESNFLNSKIAFSTDLFISRQDRLTWLSGIRLKDLYLPQVSDPAINRMLQIIKVRMIDSIKDKNPGTMGSYIEYDNGAKSIELYLPAIINYAKEVGHMPANQIRSTFIHEMQHALDDIKSQGRFDNIDSKLGQRSTTGSEEQRHRQYLKLPYEINARFTQAILDIALQYNKIEGPYRLQDLIKNAFKNHSLDVASNKQYKHLAVRAYKFFDALQNSPMKIEPKSLAQRALAWITSQPSSEIKEDISLPKNKWELLISNADKQDAGSELVSLVKHAYSVTPKGSMIQSLKDVIPSDWNVIDWDNEPDIDACVFYRKNRQDESWVGYKIQGLGHDGTRPSKDKAIQKMLALLQKPGVWIESSDALRHVLHKLNAPVITDEKFLQRLFNDQSLHMVQNDTYRRTLQNGQEIQETVFGKPKLK